MAKAVKPKVTKRNYSKKQDNKEEILLTEKEVWSVLEFANNIYQGGVYTPQLVNQQMQNISMSPQMATAEKIDAALLDPTNNENTLIGYNEFFELTSMLYKRTLYYLSGMLSFDLSYVPMGEDIDFKSSAYKKDVKIVNDFLDKFNVKKEFGTAIKQMLRQETFFSVFRNDGEKYTLQQLDHEYCLITGRWDYGFLFDYDMLYFLQPGVDINMFPKIFKTFWRRLFGNKTVSSIQYNPAASVDKRNSKYIYWVQTSPQDGFWAFKFTPEMATNIPFLSSMMPDVVLQPIIRKLQTNSYIASASKIVLGQIPMLNKDVKGGVVRDSVAVSPELLGKFLGLLKAGLTDAIKVGAAPLDDMKGISFPLDTPFYEEFLKVATSTSGINSRLIFSLDKNNSTESLLSIDVDTYLMTPVYKQFEDFLEYFINKETKKYKFKMKLDGTNFHTNRAERLETQTTLLGFGIVDYQAIASAIGMLPHDFLKRLEMTKALGFVDSLTPIVMGSQMSSETAVGKNTAKGRPTKPISKLTDSGIQTKDDSSNLNK